MAFLLTVAIVLGIRGVGAAPTSLATTSGESEFGGYAQPQVLVRLPDGRHANLFCGGKRAPTVIVESGWGTPAFDWADAQAAIAQTARICVFERAGYGFSDPGPFPRDSAAGVTDLYHALRAARLKPPYILLGHSLGGFDARLFTYLHRADVAGLLLLDPPTENLYRRTRTPDEDIAGLANCARLARAGRLHPGGADGCVEDPATALPPGSSQPVRARYLADASRASWFETLVSEDEAMVHQSADELADHRGPLGDLPLVVLQADADCRATPLVTPASRRVHERCQALDEQAGESSRGRHSVVQGSGHYIYKDRLQVVTEALEEIVAAARRGAAR